MLLKPFANCSTKDNIIGVELYDVNDILTKNGSIETGIIQDLEGIDRVVLGKLESDIC